MSASESSTAYQAEAARILQDLTDRLQARREIEESFLSDIRRLVTDGKIGDKRAVRDIIDALQERQS